MTRPKFESINNEVISKYNIIDALIFGFGYEKWDRLCVMFVPYVQKYPNFQDLWATLQGKRFLLEGAVIPNPVLYVVLACLHWSIHMEGRLANSGYGIHLNIDLSVPQPIEVTPCCS